MLDSKLSAEPVSNAVLLDLTSFDEEMIREIQIASQQSSGDIRSEIRNFEAFSLLKYVECKFEFKNQNFCYRSFNFVNRVQR